MPWISCVSHICGENVFVQKSTFAPKTVCIYSSHSFWVSKFKTTMGEPLINLVPQYPALWDKQDAMYKDSGYKEAKLKEIMQILHLNKEYVIKKWKSLRDTYVRHKNIKFKSRDGSRQCKPKWKYYDIMSFIDITTKVKVCTNLFNSIIYTIYIHAIDNYIWFWSDQFRKNHTKM